MQRPFLTPEPEAPLYQRLADTLESMIQGHSLRPGDRIPSVRHFSAQQRVSIPTALRIEQFPTTVMAVDLHTDLIAGVQVTLGGWAHSVSGICTARGAPCIVDNGSRATNPSLAYRESERL